jgi:hypothetical protein
MLTPRKVITSRLGGAVGFEPVPRYGTHPGAVRSLFDAPHHVCWCGDTWRQASPISSVARELRKHVVIFEREIVELEREGLDRP